MLPIHQKKAIDLLPDNSRLYVSAKHESEVISKLEVGKANEVILSLITICLQDAGAKDAADTKVKVFLTERLLSECKSKFATLTTGELQIALNEGVRGNYGQFMGINVATIHNWIKSYYADEARKISLNYFNHLLTMQNDKPEPSPEEKKLIIQRGCIQAYEDFKRGEQTLIPKIIYDYLKEYFKIDWTREERFKIKEDATNRFESELKLKKVSREITKTQYENILKSGNTLDIEMKRTALKYYFRKLKESGKEIIFTNQ